MASIKFGIGHISSPTPASINLFVRITTVFIGIFLGWMNTNSLIGAHTASIISSIGGLLLALINGIAPLFGVELSEKTVSTSEVTAIKTP